MPTLDETLVTIPDVCLIEVGTWQASTGEVTFTQEHLEGAIAALSDPAVKQPRMRFGHTDASTSPDESAGGFDSQPCVGKFTNLRLEDDGNKLVGDLVGVPKWLAGILPIAYPNRSVEAYFSVKTQTGGHHPMVITSVAVLGEEYPGVATLDDLQLLFSEDGPDWAADLVGGEIVHASAAKEVITVPEGGRVSASVEMSAVRTAFYEQVATEESGRYWWWLTNVYVDPQAVIADNEDGEFYFVPYSIKGSAVEFGDPRQVFIQWVESETGKVAAEAGDALPGGKPDHTYASAGESRPEERQAQWNDNKNKEATRMSIDMDALRKLYGLPEDADEDAINAAITEAAQRGDDDDDDETEGEPEGQPEGQPEAVLASGAGAVTIDPATWEDIQRRLGQVDDIVKTSRAQENEQVLTAAVRAGKFPPSRKAHYKALLEGPDREGTIEFISKLEGTIPVGELGTEGGDDASVDGPPEGYDRSWLSPAEQKRVAAAEAGTLGEATIVAEA